MDPYPAIVGGYARFREWQLARVHADPVGVQGRVLRSLLRRAARTAWGREFDFGSIRSVAEYQRRVPIQNYAAMRDWWQRCFDGEADVTWPGRPRFFAQTSGTTAGDKYVPVTPSLLRSHAKAAADVLVVYARRGRERLRRVLGGRFLCLSGPTTFERRGAVRIGDMSGIAAGRVRWPLTRRYSPGRDLAAIADWEIKIQRIAERVARENITFLTGLPSWVKVLLDQVVRATGGSSPETIAAIWPNLTLFAHGGMFFEPYRPVFDTYFAGLDVDYLDVYSASEASIGVQSDPGDPAMLMGLDHSIFYEFVPLADWGQPDPPRLTIADVEVGVPYVILVTTPAGLWSYDLGDVVRFTSLRPVKLRIAGRHRLFINAFGENIISEYVEAAVAHACAETGARVHEYTAAPRYADATRPLPAHEYVIEFAAPPADVEAFRRAIDATLCACSQDYAIKRRGNVAMGCVEITLVPKGTFYAWMKQRNMLGGQHKVPRCANDRAHVDALRKVAGLDVARDEAAHR
ncbi:MAG: GH3 auxin-responsive promoter family protein [Phycisphaerae bacterium]|nr:GH3 auxin-responsive promoter family protein [Phycisphaerae bacterium]